jgi:hypothetical protein
MGDQPYARPLPTQDNTNTELRYPYLECAGVRYDPILERAKTFHALDRAATVMGYILPPSVKMKNSKLKIYF